MAEWGSQVQSIGLKIRDSAVQIRSPRFYNLVMFSVLLKKDEVVHMDNQYTRSAPITGVSCHQN